MNRKLIENFLISPLARTIAFVSSSIIAAILAGTFVTEITVNGTIQWSQFYKTLSFYGLALQSILVYGYQRFLFSYERKVEKFADAVYCKAYVMSKCLPEMADKYIQMIRNGQGGDLKRAMDELRRSLQ